MPLGEQGPYSGIQGTRKVPTLVFKGRGIHIQCIPCKELTHQEIFETDYETADAIKNFYWDIMGNTHSAIKANLIRIVAV